MDLGFVFCPCRAFLQDRVRGALTRGTVVQYGMIVPFYNRHNFGTSYQRIHHIMESCITDPVPFEALKKHTVNWPLAWIAP